MALSHYVLSLSLLVIGLAGVFCDDQPPIVNVNVTDPVSKIFCVKISGGFRIAVNYTNKDDKKVVGLFDIPKNATVQSGTCGNGNTQDIIVDIIPDWSMKMQFKKNATEKNWAVSQVDFTYGTAPFPDAKQVNTSRTVSSTKGDIFQSIGLNSSFQCRSSQNVNFTDADIIGFETVQLQLQAFHLKNETQFENPVGCEADQVSNIVPIAVGAALGALVIIVLIAYFIGRSRNKRGYESV